MFLTMPMKVLLNTYRVGRISTEPGTKLVPENLFSMDLKQ